MKSVLAKSASAKSPLAREAMRPPSPFSLPGNAAARAAEEQGKREALRGSWAWTGMACDCIVILEPAPGGARAAAAASQRALGSDLCTSTPLAAPLAALRCSGEAEDLAEVVVAAPDSVCRAGLSAVTAAIPWGGGWWTPSPSPPPSVACEQPTLLTSRLESLSLHRFWEAFWSDDSATFLRTARGLSIIGCSNRALF